MIFKTDLQKEYYTDEHCHIIEILNTPDVANISIARARVEPGITTELHAVDVDELYYILEGEGKVEVDGDPQQKVGPGDVVYIKTGLSQRITNTGTSDLLFLCVCQPRFRQEGYTTLD